MSQQTILSRALVTLLAGYLPPQAALAQIDDLQIKLIRQLELPLRWDNVEDRSPYWQSGAAPNPHKHLPWHAVSLSPGQSIAVRVPAGEGIRLIGTGAGLSKNDLQVHLSEGSGLSIQKSLLPGDDGHSLLLEGHPSRPGIAYIERPGTATSPVDLAIFVSRHIPYPPLAPYRKVHELNAPTRTMGRSNEGGSQTYWQLEGGQSQTIELRGPARFALQGRFIYPDNESAIQQGWQVRLGTAEEALVQMQFEAGVDSATAVIIDGRETPATRQKEAWFEVPAGRHRYQLQASGPFLARLLEQEDSDYLIPALNEPAFPARDARPGPEDHFLQKSTWEQTPEETLAALATEASPAAARQAGLHLALDNRLRDGGLIATRMLQATAERHKDAPAILQEADEFSDLHTFLRDLLPTTPAASTPSRYAWYLLPRLLDIGEQGRGRVAAEQHERNLLDRMTAGMFTPLPSRNQVQEELAAVPNHELTVHFDTDSSRLDPINQERLRQFATAVRQGGGSIEVVGHTDIRASDSYNLALSRRRAEAVASFLGRHGLSPNHLRLAARGFWLPAADNKSESGRAANRRVTLRASVAIAASPADVHEYLLPERSAPSRLHLAVHAEAGATREILHIQFDDQAPMALRVEATPEVSPERFEPTAGETTLLLQRWRHGEYGGSTVAAAFSRSQTPALLIPAGSIDLDLPREVRRIRAWRSSAEQPGQRIWLAVKMRVAKPYALSESGLLAITPDSNTTDAGITRLLAAIAREQTDSTELPIRELDSHLQPLARLIRTESRSLTETVTPPPHSHHAGQDAAPVMAAARNLEAAANWLPALEKWGAAASLARTEQQAEITHGRVRALIALGESFLAEQLLKQALLYSGSITERRQAGEALARFYRQTGDQEGLLSLACASFTRDPDSSTLQNLTEILQENGLPDFALAASQLLPASQRPLQTVLRAALKQDRWQIFQAAVEALPSETDRQYWRGLKLAMTGKIQAAQELLMQASRAGHESAREVQAHLEQGIAIDRARRAAEIPGAALLADWGNWQAAAPGQREWLELPPMVRSSAGGAGLHSIDRDAYFSMQRANASHPLQLGFFGPATLRLEARPEHHIESDELLEGWLRVRETTAGSAPKLWVFPISQNPPASSLRIVGSDTQVPGQKLTAEMNFGPGWHELEVEGGQLPLLVRSLVSLPELRFPVLPLLTAETARRPEVIPLPQVASDFLGCRSCTVLIPEHKEEAVARFQSGQRLLRQNHVSLRDVSTPRFASNTPGGTEDFAAALASNDLEKALATPVPQGANELLHYLSGLLWFAEREPQQHERILVVASAIVARHPEIPALQGVLDRLARESGWIPLNNVQGGAGLRARRIDNFEPENPALRIRQSLLPPIKPNEYLLTGNNRLVLSLFNAAPTQFQLHLESADVSGLLPRPLQAYWQIDEQAPKRLTLQPGAGTALQPLNLGTGEHSIRFWIESPVAGQFLRLQLAEHQRADRRQTVVDSSERFYHVATRQEPLRVSLPGPMWLRIDEWVEGKTESSYRLLPEAWNELELPPAKNQSEALYRLFFRGSIPDQEIIPPRLLDIASEPVPPPLTTLSNPPQAIGIALRDGLPLGGQEDGTWSWSGGLHHRSFSSTDNTSQNKPALRERYLEAGASWRYQDADHNNWYKADLLGRRRERGGATLVLRPSILHTPLWSSWNFGAEASLFLQNPGSDAEGTAYAYRLRGFMQQRRDLHPKAYHLPQIAAFIRHSSLQDGAAPIAYQQGRIDQDIFTPYTARHGSGLEIGDTLVLQPRLDTQLHMGAQLVSNPDFNIAQPDHVGASMGWKQLLGPANLHLRMEAKHYFADAERRKAQTTQQLGLDLGGELWRSHLHRLELKLSLVRDISDRVTYGNITFTWHMGNGRGYTDFRPGEIDFRDLRFQRIPQEENNHRTEIFAPPLNHEPR